MKKESNVKRNKKRTASAPAAPAGSISSLKPEVEPPPVYDEAAKWRLEPFCS